MTMKEELSLMWLLRSLGEHLQHTHSKAMAYRLYLSSLLSVKVSIHLLSTDSIPSLSLGSLYKV
ncbi:mCG1028970 [Mus musculus]|nr:mCG1028970 [Mus musculus]